MESFYGSVEQGKEGIVGGVAKALVKELTGKEGKIGETKIKTSEKQEDKKLGVAFVDNKWSAVDNDGKVVFNSDNRKDVLEFVKQNNLSTQHSIEITPELKKSVEAGMPLFGAAQKQSTIQLLENLKIDTKNTLSFFGILPAAWNKIIDGIILAVKAGKNITKAIQEAIEKIKAANPKVDEKALNEYFNSRSQAIDLISFAQQEGQSKSDLLDALEGHPDLQEAVGEMWSEEKKPSDEMTLGRMVANIPHSSEVKDYLSGETIKKYENEEALRNAQEYQVLQLKEALAHGVD